jgi:mono/diheme cytochrome c family protein
MRRLLVVAVALALVATVGAVLVYRVTQREVRLQVSARPGTDLKTAHASLARGEYLYQVVARCAQCHASDLGGRYVLHNGLVATLWGPNLTRGNPSVGIRYTNADFERAIRRGLRPDGMRLLLMPSWDYAAMSDDDVASVIAYIRAAPAVERIAPAFHVGILGRLMLLTGRLDFDSDRIPDAVQRDDPRPAGPYIARVGACLRCHGAAGQMRALGKLDIGTFTAALQNGRDPAGREISAHAVPAGAYRWRDADVAALDAYVRQVSR